MILTVEQQEALVRYLCVRAGELNYTLGALEYAGPDSIRFSHFVWRVPEEDPVGIVDLRHLVDIALQAQILMERPVISNTTGYTPVANLENLEIRGFSPVIETDVIGGFPFARPNCCGCDRPLLLENAWMSDGCECNSPLGVNSMNETRWRLLMQLQQRQNHEISRIIAAVTGAGVEIVRENGAIGVTRTLPGPSPGHVLLELPLP